jgi:hypothetical protein
VKRNVRRLIEDAGISDVPIVGFVDLSFNIHSQNLWPSHWQPHLEFLTPTDVWREIKEPLREQLSKSESVKIPLRGVPVRNFQAQVSYAFKPSPLRKTYFPATSPKARPHKQWLKGAQEVEFLLWLGDQKADARSFTLGVRQYGRELRMLR